MYTIVNLDRREVGVHYSKFRLEEVEVSTIFILKCIFHKHSIMLAEEPKNLVNASVKNPI